MRLGVFIGFVATLAACHCGVGVQTDGTLPLVVAPNAVDFGPVYVGATKTLAVDVSNPAHVSSDVSLGVSDPFSVTPSSFTLTGGSDLQISAAFSPSAPGPFSSSVEIGDAGLTLSGIGLAPLVCTPSNSCHSSTFDPQAGACVETALPDDVSCVSTYACFASASCQAGECVGTLTTCDDHNPCTLEVCGELGCGHIEGLSGCPAPTDPCLIPSCDPDAGCGFGLAPDGVSCGGSDCHTAQVCIGGACVVRAIPQSQACVEVVAGRPVGTGFVDGIGTTARFRPLPHLAVDASGNVWVTDDGNRRLRKVSPAGRVTTVAGALPPDNSFGFADGFGPTAQFGNPRELAFDAAGNIIVDDTGLLRKVSPAGLVITWTGGAVLEPFMTVTPGIGPAASVGDIWGLCSGAAGELWAVAADQQREQVVLLHISSNGEVSTRALLEPLVTLGGWYDVTWASGHVLVSDDQLGVRELLPDGGLQLVSNALGIRRLSASASGDIAFAEQSSVTVRTPDGGVRLRWSSGADDIEDLAPYTDGRWVLALGSLSVVSGVRIVLLGDAGVTLLAGPDWPLPPGDGPVATAGLLDPYGIAETPDGALFISEDDGIHRLGDGALSMYWPHPINDAFESDLAATAGGQVILTSTEGVFRISDADAGIETTGGFCRGVDARANEIALNCDGLLFSTPDGGWRDAGYVAGNDVALDDRGGVYVQEPAGVAYLGADGGFTPVAGSGLTGFVDGPGATALFGLLSGIAWAPTGELYVSDGTNFAIRKISTAGDVSTVARLADQPRRILVEDGGSLLVTVPDAVLRIRP